MKATVIMDVTPCDRNTTVHHRLPVKLDVFSLLQKHGRPFILPTSWLGIILIPDAQTWQRRHICSQQDRWTLYPVASQTQRKSSQSSQGAKCSSLLQVSFGRQTRLAAHRGPRSCAGASAHQWRSITQSVTSDHGGGGERVSRRSQLMCREEGQEPRDGTQEETVKQFYTF